MNPARHEELRPLLDAYVDGDLTADEEMRVRAWLEASPEAVEFLEQDLDLGHALYAILRAPAQGEAATVAVDRLARVRRRWAVTAAAACILATVLGFIGGALTSGTAEEPGPGTADPRLNAVNASYIASPDAVIEELGTTGRRVRLQRGSLHVLASTEPFFVSLAAADVKIMGAVDMLQVPPAGAQSEAHGVITVLSGRVRITLRAGDGTETVGVGETVVVTSIEITRIADLLGPDRSEADDEIASVPFSEDEDPDVLQERLTGLLAVNRQLRLEVGALRNRAGGRRQLTPGELFASLASRLANQDMSDEATWCKIFGSMKTLRGMLGKNPVEARLVIHGVLADGTRPDSERALAMRLLGGLRDEKLGAMLEPFLGDPSLALRMSATAILSRRPEPRNQKLLADVYGRADEHPSVRVIAAGGLVRLGDYGEPLEWMIDTWRGSEDDPDLRSRIMSRIVYAPLDRIGDFLIEAARASDLNRRNFRGVIILLSRLGGAEAERVLDVFSTALSDPDLRERARTTLARIRGGN